MSYYIGDDSSGHCTVARHFWSVPIPAGGLCLCGSVRWDCNGATHLCLAPYTRYGAATPRCDLAAGHGGPWHSAPTPTGGRCSWRRYTPADPSPETVNRVAALVNECLRDVLERELPIGSARALARAVAAALHPEPDQGGHAVTPGIGTWGTVEGNT